MPLDLDADISALRGASYNPRYIGEDDLETLARSIRTLGLVKPLIVRGDLLVAGHQRTKALRHIGVNRAPVYALPSETTLYDEIRFNQLHNGTDLDAGDENCRITGGFDREGWHVVEPSRITANMRGQLAIVRKEICDLILPYGPWGGCVATRAGEVIHCAQYALAAKITNTPLTVHVLPDDKVELARDLLGRTYGVFSYDKLERHTYIQTLAQMNRLRAGPSGKGNKSTLYETMVVPYVMGSPKLRCIDFGAGHGDYAAAMRRRGLSFHDVELFRRVGASMTLDTRAIHDMIDRMILDLKTSGPYDVVVCDSVMNSVDCLDAEHAVLTVLNMLCRKGGTVFFSGRPAEDEAVKARYTKSIRETRYVEFLDKDGFTALFRKGKWFYQKYHSKAQVEDIAKRHGFEIVKHAHGNNSWQCQMRKIHDLPVDVVDWACDYEFDLPLGPNERIGRNEDVKSAVHSTM